MLRVQSAHVLAVLTALTTIACGDPEVPEQPMPTASAPTAAPTASAPAPAPTAAPTTAAPATGPCDATMQLALQTAIKGREQAEVGFGMKPEGAFACETIADGGKVSVPVSLLPGKCYTFLAHGFPNITDIDLFLKPNLGPTPPPLLAGFAGVVLAQDSDQGPVASIGKGKGCFKNPFPIPGAGVVEAVSKQGGGPLAIQVYSK
jgi:hypothetical protein